MKVCDLCNHFVFQRWLNSLHEHCAYSTFYTTQPTLLIDDNEQDVIPLGNMRDSLKVSAYCRKIMNGGQCVCNSQGHGGRFEI